MYLSYLKPFHKESFLDLSLIISNADQEFNVLEKNFIEQLCEEMRIEPKFSTEKSLDEVLDSISSSATLKEKKIILLEVLGVVMVDNDVKVEEIEIVTRLLNKFALKKEDFDVAITLVKKIYNIYSECSNFINE